MFENIEICAMNLHYSRFPLEVFFDDIVCLGLRRIELWGASPHFYIGDNSFGEAKALKQAIKERELQLSCFTPEQCVYPIDLATSNHRLRDRSIQYFLDSINLCVELDCPRLLVTPGFGYMSEDLSEVRARSLEALHRLAKHAEAMGVKIFLEPLPAAYSQIINTSEELNTMLHALSSPAIAGMIDTACAHISGENIADYSRNLGDRLQHIHMVDTDRTGAHLAWGDGNLSITEYLKDIELAGYTGMLSLEIIGPRYHQNPLVPLKQSVECLRHHMKA